MSRVQSEYDVEIKFINRLESIGYEYIELKNYLELDIYEWGVCWRNNQIEYKKFLDIISNILYYSRPQKPCYTAPESRYFYEFYSGLVPTILLNKAFIMKKEYKYLFRTAIYMSTAMLYSEMHHYQMDQIKPEQTHQKELRNFILEYRREFYDKDIYMIKKLEYYLVLPVFEDTEMLSDLKDIINYFYPRNRYSIYWNNELEKFFKACELDDDKLLKYFHNHDDTTITASIPGEDIAFTFRNFLYYSELALMQRRIYKYHYPQYFDYCFGLIKNWNKVKYDELTKAYHH